MQPKCLKGLGRPAHGVARSQWRSAVLALVLAVAAMPMGVAAQTKPVAAAAGTSGLGVPRYASLKFDRVNLRSGPGTEYPTVWVYRKAGLPLEITKEYEAWRQVRDAEGAAGWVLQSSLSGRRTALVQPWEFKAGTPPPQVALYGDASDTARLVAKVEAGVIANVLSCDTKWCFVSLDQFKGYIQQKKLWGVYETETLK
jgi:SH3-like domain-containing protein